MKNLEQTLARLEELSRFKEIFNSENLGIGLNVWIRSSGIQLIVSVVLYLSGLLEMLGQAGMLILLVLNFALLQWAVSSEGRHRFDIQFPPPAGWFSVFWRVLLMTLPVAFVLVSIFISPQEVANQADLEKVQQKMLTVQIILLFVNIVPTGIATSQTLRNHVRQLQMYRKGGFNRTENDSSSDKQSGN
jgi:hypothetical protein